VSGERAVRALRTAELDPAVAMLVRAFADDPFSALLAPEPAQRPAAARWAFAAFARYGLAFGQVQTVDDLAGVAIWWAPEYVHPTAARAAQVGLTAGRAVLGAAAWARFEAFGALTDELHRRSVAGPHWYLNVLGVAPEAQRRGIGSALLAAMCARLDRERLPAYLDTGTAANVAYYERRGFVVTAEAREPATGLHVRGLRRDPR
jgi:ribosomal protein S18 acetylase RimI-like enzyme